jgi:hypothetical protein
MGRINSRGALVATIAQGDATTTAAQETAHIPTLTIALVHLAGNVGLMKHEWRPAYRLGGDSQGELSPAVQVVMHVRALEALAAIATAAARCRRRPRRRQYDA